MTVLRDHPELLMSQLLDVCVVDYLHYGVAEWGGESSTSQGYPRAVAEVLPEESTWTGPRFVVVCHFLSIVHNRRLRVRVHLGDDLTMPTLSTVWPSALWYEREAYDLFGVIFSGHPDLRRILTDYGFVGFPFRKDFPLIGTVEMRYDGEKEQCVYEPVSIENRVGVPKVIRDDHRYVKEDRAQS
ncbi:NADH-quinone oxidoreductase subunit C [Gammaproteobacteria bacterium Comchoano-2]|uniref:NADH-quinone oxidoreductase subunit C n=2 Tax=Candidatus Synchoanobacter obligatus TaxID=2919597 RepID=A0ABT1L480_9GAMM|nr:NADH-quinone oxidoreductase subunit C [Candidatus Synchoanobacter obligatus]